MDLLLADPVDGGGLQADELLGLEPERDLLLRGVWKILTVFTFKKPHFSKKPIFVQTDS